MADYTLDFMYGRKFQGADGHQWEVFWMDMAAAEDAARQAPG